jgi:retinal rod rhodopsin-sensitive cGMP 3',5'-cyclic phosphodiesterase subunit delta
MSLKPEISEDESFEKIKSGFKINLIQMKDGDSGKMMWDCKDWDFSSSNQTVKISKELLKCKIIKRNVNFSSVEKIEDLELIQNFYLMGELFESSRFKFGFVIPNSTNDWEQIIEAKEDGVLPAEVLSGKLKVETLFLCEGKIIIKNKILIYYV